MYVISKYFLTNRQSVSRNSIWCNGKLALDICSLASLVSRYTLTTVHFIRGQATLDWSVRPVRPVWPVWLVGPVWLVRPRLAGPAGGSGRTGPCWRVRPDQPDQTSRTRPAGLAGPDGLAGPLSLGKTGNGKMELDICSFPITVGIRRVTLRARALHVPQPIAKV